MPVWRCLGLAGLNFDSYFRITGIYDKTMLLDSLILKVDVPPRKLKLLVCEKLQAIIVPTRFKS